MIEGVAWVVCLCLFETDKG